MTDQELVEYLRQGDVKAFEEIYDRHWWPVYLIAYRKIRSKEVAEELVQDLFASLWKKHEQLEIRTSLPAYLKASIHYLIINYYHATLVRRNHQQHLRYTTSPESPVTEETLNLWELQREMELGVSQLPDKSRQIFEMSRFEEQSNRDIARQLDLSEKAVEYHITKSLRLLRLYLKDFLTVLILYPLFLS